MEVDMDVTCGEEPTDSGTKSGTRADNKEGLKSQIKNKVRIAIDNGVDPNFIDTSVKIASDELPLLSLAVQINDTELVKLLIDKGANVNWHDSQGWTPLLDACTYKLHEIAKILISKGANVNAKLNDGFSALMLAMVNEGNNALVKLLVQNGADMDYACEQLKIREAPIKSNFIP